MRPKLSRATSKKKRVAKRWPDPRQTPAQVAARVHYVGSAEHKNHPSSLDPTGRLRSDAEKCPPAYAQPAQAERLTAALRDAIRKEQVSEAFDPNGLPRYVWGWLDDQLFECRRLSHPPDGYKGFPIRTAAQYPDDPAGKLKR